MFSKKTLYVSLSILLMLVLCLGTGLAQTSTAPPSNTPPTPDPNVGPTSPPTPAPGVEPTSPPTHDDIGPTPKERAQVNDFLINHPQLAEQLHNNPSLINNPQWLSEHPEVKQWMNAHPEAQHIAAEHPDWAVKQAEGSALSDARHGIKTTDSFLSQHPKVAQELAKDPSLIDNKEYLSQHPALQGYLNSHPEIKNEWQSHPDAFAHAAEGYAARHDQGGPKPPQKAAAARPVK